MKRSLFFKTNKHETVRLSGGLGYIQYLFTSRQLWTIYESRKKRSNTTNVTEPIKAINSTPFSINSIEVVSATLLPTMRWVGYIGGDDAAQVSIVKDVSPLSARNRSRLRSTIILYRWRRRGISSHRVRVTDAPLLRCEPAHVKELHEAANPPPFCLLENKQNHMHNTIMKIIIHELKHKKLTYKHTYKTLNQYDQIFLVSENTYLKILLEIFYFISLRLFNIIIHVWLILVYRTQVAIYNALFTAVVINTVRSYILLLHECWIG